MREWKQLHGRQLLLAWIVCAGVVFLIFSPLFVPVILHMTVKGWLFLAVCLVGALVANALFSGVLVPAILGLLVWILGGLARLLPRRLRQNVGEDVGQPVNRATGLALIVGFVVALIAFFAWRFHTLAVIIPFIMVAVIVGFFSLVNRVDLRLQARKARRLSEANEQVQSIAEKRGSG